LLTLRSFIKLFVWEIVNPLVLRSRRNQVYDWNPRFNGMNLGCGLDVLPQWIGVDGGVFVLYKRVPHAILRRAFPTLNMSEVYTYEEYVKKLNSVNVLHHDLKYGIPFKSNTVPNIYSSHLLEHFSIEEGKRLLSECFRVLRPGGAIRIAVPSLEQEVNQMRAAIALYDQGEIEEVVKYLTARPGFSNQYNAHRCMYNFNKMKILLESVGFVGIRETTYKCGKIIDVEKLDTRRESLFVEATKGKL